jgi:xanthine dehydrogenase accessory factor
MKVTKHEIELWSVLAERMKESIEECNTGIAIAVVVEAVGSTPQKSGAKMLLLEDGSTFGTVGGGLVEALVIEKAKECMRAHTACLFYPHTSDEFEKPRLRCGGRMTIFIDGCVREHRSVISQVVEALKNRHRRCFLIQVQTEGDELKDHRWILAEPTASSYKAVSCKGEVFELPKEVVEAIQHATLNDKPSFNKLSSSLCFYIEPLKSPFRLVVVGAGHVGKCVAQLGSLVGFEVIVIDDRIEFASKERLPFADAIICDDIASAISRLRIDEDTAIVIVSYSHEVDAKALSTALRTSASYIGMMGSKRKVNHIFKSLLSNNSVDEKELSRVHAPIGLEIGAVTPMEIAISIIAEVIASYRVGNPQKLRPT